MHLPLLRSSWTLLKSPGSYNITNGFECPICIKTPQIRFWVLAMLQWTREHPHSYRVTVLLPPQAGFISTSKPNKSSTTAPKPAHLSHQV